MLINLFLLDPVSDIEKNISRDTSALLMERGLERGHRIFYSTLKDLLLTPQFLRVKSREVISVNIEKGFRFKENQDFFTEDFDVIWLRKDPPFDETYLMHLALFDQLSSSKTLFINNPRSIRELNEKLTIFYFPDFIVETIVTMNLDEIHAFWKHHKKIVVKGLVSFGGKSVIAIENFEKDYENLLDLSANGTRFLMVQPFLEKVYEGDKRVTLLNGEIAGALLRVPPENSFIAYTGGGASVHQTELTKREIFIAETVGQFLKEKGVVWAGLDFIDEHLSEINITSPSLLAKAVRDFHLDFDVKVWEMAENIVSSGSP